MTRRYYTQEERSFIEASYSTMSRAEIASALNRPEASVKLFIQRNKHIRKGPPKSCFKKGDVPWNAGVKGWVRKGASTDFKKSREPHNATRYYDGQVVAKLHKDGSHYQYRRLTKGDWVLSHRYNWELLHGAVPTGYCLTCRSEDTLNDAASNWELISLPALAAKNGIWAQHRASTKLTPNYLAATLTKGRPDLRAAVLASPALLEVQRLKITLNRTLTHAVANPIQ